jgi:hypothetical protein
MDQAASEGFAEPLLEVINSGAGPRQATDNRKWPGGYQIMEQRAYAYGRSHRGLRARRRGSYFDFKNEY